MSATLTTPEHGGRKATYICSECGHESPPTGDWQVRTGGRRRDYRCPDCGHLVLSQPTFEGDGHDSTLQDDLAAVGHRLCRATARAASATAAALSHRSALGHDRST